MGKLGTTTVLLHDPWSLKGRHRRGTGQAGHPGPRGCSPVPGRRPHGGRATPPGPSSGRREPCGIGCAPDDHKSGLDPDRDVTALEATTAVTSLVWARDPAEGGPHMAAAVEVGFPGHVT